MLRPLQNLVDNGVPILSPNRREFPDRSSIITTMYSTGSVNLPFRNPVLIGTGSSWSTRFAIRSHQKRNNSLNGASISHSTIVRRSVANSTTAHESKSVDEMATEVFRKDYKATPYLVETVSLSFNLNEDVTTVEAKSHFIPNPLASADTGADLFLNGRSDMKLVSIKFNDDPVPVENLTMTKDSLTIRSPPTAPFDLEVVTEIKPQENTLLAGLYKSSGNFCTQCEAEGYRGITYYYDRPDVMSKYDVRIEAQKEQYPVLLSNGNLAAEGDLPNGRHFKYWIDPFPKPCYLFALVAGDLAFVEDSFITHSSKMVTLRIYVQHHNKNKVGHAMNSLKQAMKWDEDRFGLEYDLELFNIVVVDDFNMGAMENKSLNVFNSRCVLASPETATDTDYGLIQGVIGHEYFHNWTGNRVTCKDWFQLTLKEGLTVFRDREFTSDLNSRSVKRINDVKVLRSSQFPEDEGPMAHPIRPDSYIKMDNFYTSTVYRKGAEIIGIYQTILGVDGFRKGMDLYFQRHDGQAVTCDDFLNAMATANSKDLTALSKWYGQAGTPQLTISTNYDSKEKTYTIKASQKTPPTPGQTTKEPVLIPIKIGLLGPDGKELELKLRGEKKEKEDSVYEKVLEFDQESTEFVFMDIPIAPVPSILRSFSAPVRLTVEGQTDEDLVFLFTYDTDDFNRWEAGQRLTKKVILKLYEDGKTSGPSFGPIPSFLIDAFKAVLEDENLNGYFASMVITLPSQKELISEIHETDPVLLHQVMTHVAKQLAVALEGTLIQTLTRSDSSPDEVYDLNSTQVSKRALKNSCLRYLARLEKSEYLEDCLKRFRTATNMTDSIAAVSALIDIDCRERKLALEEFYKKWKHEFLVVNKWLTLQAMSDLADNTKQVEALFEHEAYHGTNPNCNYALFLGFAASSINFHASDGSGYELFAKKLIQFDKINGQAAARVSSVLTQWKQFDPQRQELMKKYIKQIVDSPGLSENTKEIMMKTLEA
eukprot:g417.t1